MPGAGAAQFADGTTEDVFALVLRSRDATFDAGEARRLLLESGAAQVVLKEVVSMTVWRVVLPGRCS